MYTTRDILRMSDRAVLYRGHRTDDGQPVVIKVLAAQHRPQQRERLKNDYELASMLDLPTVVRPVALDTYQGMPALLARYSTFVYLPMVIEPFGRVVAEAWAAGCEVITNELVGARYWIEQDPGALETTAGDFWDLVVAP